MKIVRLYAGQDGRSHFGEIEVDFKPSRTTEASALEAASGIVFHRAPAGHVLDWHPAPQRQYVVTLSGEGQVEVSDGTVRRLGPGDIMLAEDTTGKGHITRVVGNQPRLYATIPLK